MRHGLAATGNRYAVDLAARNIADEHSPALIARNQLLAVRATGACNPRVVLVDYEHPQIAEAIDVAIFPRVFPLGRFTQKLPSGLHIVGLPFVVGTQDPLPVEGIGFLLLRFQGNDLLAVGNLALFVGVTGVGVGPPPLPSNAGDTRDKGDCQDR